MYARSLLRAPSRLPLLFEDFVASLNVFASEREKHPRLSFESAGFLADLFRTEQADGVSFLSLLVD